MKTASLDAFPDIPIPYGIHGGIKNFYKAEPEVERPATLDSRHHRSHLRSPRAVFNEQEPGELITRGGLHAIGRAPRLAMLARRVRAVVRGSCPKREPGAHRAERDPKRARRARGGLESRAGAHDRGGACAADGER